MVIARNTTELRYIDEYNNSSKLRFVINEVNYKIPLQKTLKQWVKKKNEK